MSGKRAFLTFRLQSVVLIVLVVAVIAAATYFWVNDRLGVLRAVYPLEALVAERVVQCSPQAPAWMGDSLRQAVRAHSSLANQLAYLAPDGHLHHCENGWRGAMFRSPRIDEHTVFRLASLTKLLTADAVLARVNAGELHLETRVLDVFPELRPVADVRLEAVTVDHLLRHRAGFDRLKTPDPMARQGVRPWCPGALGQLTALKLDFDPGQRAAYSNLGYCLLGEILAKVSGKPFRQLMEEEYGLAGVGLRFVDGPYGSDEVRYDFRNSAFYGEDYHRHFDFPALSSSAGLAGNAASFARLVKAMLEREPLNILSAPVPAGCDPRAYRTCYGFALGHYLMDGADIRLHLQGGLLYGATSTTIVDSRGGVTVWLGSGMSREGVRKAEGMDRFFYQALDNFYQQH